VALSGGATQAALRAASSCSDTPTMSILRPATSTHTVSPSCRWWGGGHTESQSQRGKILSSADYDGVEPQLHMCGCGQHVGC
jgi:hypothetical protein